MPLTVESLLKEKSADLRLELHAGREGVTREITVSELNRPGLALGGFFENFRWERVQVIGRGEYAYLQSNAGNNALEPLKKFFQFQIPCILLTHHLKPQPELIRLSNQFQVPLLVSALATATLVADLSATLEQQLAPTVTVHGVLVDVYGLGVLITGDSGIGKSECALELIKRGHMLVSDDLVRVQHRSGGVLVGKPASEVIKHHMEVRGLGIIDVKQLFGVSAILEASRIELAVQLEMWDDTKNYDRLGMEEQSVEILGVRIPRLTIPVRPGRNLAILIEVAALSQRLKARGIYPAQELEKNLVELLSKEAEKKGETSPDPVQVRGLRSVPGRPPYRRR